MDVNKRDKRADKRAFSLLCVIFNKLKSMISSEVSSHNLDTGLDSF